MWARERQHRFNWFDRFDGDRHVHDAGRIQLRHFERRHDRLRIEPRVLPFARLRRVRGRSLHR